MAEKRQKIVVHNSKTGGMTFNLPEYGVVEHYEGTWLVFISRYGNGGQFKDTPVFKYKPTDEDVVFVSDLSEDEELVEKIKKLDKAGMDMLRNMMDSADLLK